jgi:hypothetical protein
MLFSVHQERIANFYQVVEAQDKDEAMRIADKLDEWELDSSDSSIIDAYPVE